MLPRRRRLRRLRRLGRLHALLVRSCASTAGQVSLACQAQREEWRGQGLTCSLWGALDSRRRTLRTRLLLLLLLLLGVVLLPLLLLRRVLLRLLLLHGFGRRCAVGSRGGGLRGSRARSLGIGVLRVLR